MQRETSHARSTSTLASLRKPLLKDARRPTVDLKVMDEGYSSMPQIKDDAEASAAVDKIVNIDEDENEEDDGIIAPVALRKWQGVDGFVARLDAPLPHILINSAASSSRSLTEDIPSPNPESASDPPIINLPKSSEKLSGRWGLIPLIERLMGDKRQKQLLFKSDQASSKNLSRSAVKKDAYGLIPSDDPTLSLEPSKETQQEELINTSEDPPNFASDDEEALAIANQKLFAFKYTEASKQVGTGGHSTVRLATRNSDNTLVVCKFMQHTSVWNWYYCKKSARKIPLEIHLMQKFTAEKHPGIIKYLEHFEMAGKYVIIMEYMGVDWVDLYDYIEIYGPVIEPQSREIFKSVVETVEFMHSLGYCHNDIKDENILINKKTREIKLIDFGSATQYIPGKMFTLFYGTKKFASPEAVYGDAYDASAQEVWCLGTLLYVLLFKMDPFKDDKEIADLDICARISRLRNIGPLHGGADISNAAYTALSVMMEKDCRVRIKSKEILNLDFFTAD